MRDLTKVVLLFREESEEDLARMERTLVASSDAPVGAEQLRELFRDAHTLKGNAVSLGFGAAAELAHAAEDALARARSEGTPLSAETIAALLEAIDALREIVRAEPSSTLDGPQRDLAARLRAPPAAGAGQPAPGEAPARRATMNTISGAQGPSGAIGRARPRDDDADVRGKSVRVPVEKLDKLMRLVGEIVVARELGKDLLVREDTPLNRRLLAMQRDADRFYDELQERVIETRLVAVGTLFEQQARVVFEVARAVGKQVRLTTEGGDTEVDLAVIEQLRDPLLHVVRNAVDHGIETPADRLSRGKSAEGTLHLSAFRSGSSVVVEVRDDGAGIDRGRVLEKARALGVVAPGAIVDDAAALELIFAPGLSTAGELTEISGRGVGMDIVRRNVTALGGSVTLESQEGLGTTLRIRVPLTLGILRGFLVRVADETYVAPIDGVEECVQIQGAAPAAESGVTSLRGEPVPWLRLRRILSVTRDPPDRQETLLVLRHEGRRVGLLVDTIAGESQLVVRPLGPLLRSVHGLSGTAILGDGRACLILDADELAADASHRRPKPSETQRESP